MSGYTDHDNLTPARLKVLTRVGRGERVEIQRVQALWFVRHGYLVRTSPRHEPPRYALTDLARDATGIAESTEAVPSSTGYRSESVMKGDAR